MTSTIPQNGHNGYKAEPTASKPRWREATPCDTDFTPCEPKPVKPTPCKPTGENTREKESKETYFFMSTTDSEKTKDGGLSKLAQLLLGLATLLALGSLLSNLFLVWAISKNTNTTNNTKEVITTTNTKEIIREVEVGDTYHYAPAARW